MNIMKSRKIIPIPKIQKLLSELGANIKLARLRRNMSSELASRRAGISRSTLWQIEKGSPNVAIGAYINILFVYNLEKDIKQIAVDDVLGRKLQDIGLTVRKRSPKIPEKLKINYD